MIDRLKNRLTKLIFTCLILAAFIISLFSISHSPDTPDPENKIK